MDKTRKELLKIVSNLIELLNNSDVSPNEAKGIARMFYEAVEKSNEEGMKSYMNRAAFCGSSPEK